MVLPKKERYFLLKGAFCCWFSLHIVSFSIFRHPQCVAWFFIGQRTHKSGGTPCMSTFASGLWGRNTGFLATTMRWVYLGDLVFKTHLSDLTHLRVNTLNRKGDILSTQGLLLERLSPNNIFILTHSRWQNDACCVFQDLCEVIYKCTLCTMSKQRTHVYLMKIKNLNKVCRGERLVKIKPCIWSMLIQ